VMSVSFNLSVFNTGSMTVKTQVKLRILKSLEPVRCLLMILYRGHTCSALYVSA
jgi:hypothetical protein